jgi:hypothetical protein
MNVKHVGLCALVVTWLGASAVRAEDPPAVPGENVVQPVQYRDVETMPPPQEVGAESGPAPVPQLSRWMTGPGYDCCGPFTGRTLGYEVYLRNGVSLPFGNGVIARDLDPGWVIQGGARVLIFNPSKLAAWTADLSVSNIYNHAHGDNMATLEHIIVPGPSNIFGQSTTMVIPSIDVTFSRYNRTFVNAAFGREWYLWNPANSNGCMWRVGLDAGPRYGTEKLDLNELRHRTHVAGGAFVAVHTDLEWPCGPCIYQVGFRAEWSYTFSEILQDQNDTEVYDALLMLNFGVRF